MVPYARDRLGLNDANLGLLLLSLGAGAIVMMPIAGMLIARLGSRIVTACAVMIIAISLPLLLIISSVAPMAVTLFVFGSAIGAVDVAMNAHAIHAQNLTGRPIMSSFHGLFSVGGLLGSLGLGILIKFGLNPVHAALSISVILILIALRQYPHLLTPPVERAAIERFSGIKKQKNETPRLKWLHASVLFLGLMCFAAFLSEGAMLDWSAIFLRDIKGIAPDFAGAGYAAFSVAMAIMRLFGDGMVARFNARKVVIGGSLVASAGLMVAIFSPWVLFTLFGFILVGIGASNIVPLFFSEGGSLPGISPTVSIPAITTIGYAGQLAGPALLGFISFHFSLGTAFGFLAVLFIFVAIAYRLRKRPGDNVKLQDISPIYQGNSTDVGHTD